MPKAYYKPAVLCIQIYNLLRLNRYRTDSKYLFLSGQIFVFE